MFCALHFKPLLSFKYVRFYSSYAHKILYNMNKAYFRYIPSDNQLQISFRFKNSEFNIDRDFNFCRNINENVDACLERIKTNLEKEFLKKIKKSINKKRVGGNQMVDYSELGGPQISIQLIKNSELVNNTNFASLLSEGDNSFENTKLRIVDEDFDIIFNTPWTINLVLPNSILAGFFLYPNKMELQFADKKYSKGMWYRGLLPPSKDITRVEWEELYEGLTYNTKTDDIGYLIKFKLIPGNGKIYGPAAEAISKTEVQAGPGRCPFEERHIFTQSKLTGDKFRVTTYNILADLYADSDYTRKELFPYCPPYALSIDYRKQLYIKEILGYHSDIICLQEVDEKIFTNDLLPIFDEYYEGTMQKKGTSGEGLVTFFNKSRFDLVQKYGINIGSNIPTLGIFKILYDKIKNNTKLLERIVDRSTALQITVLSSKETGQALIVANTHLYFHPDADHIRLLQIGFSMLYIEDVYKNTLDDLKLNKKDVSVIFCGDFNSVPECGIFKLMTKKFVEENFVDWKSNPEEAVKGVKLVQPFNIDTACGCPQYTNFTHAFAACLDYIFYQTDNLTVEEIIPLPSEEDLRTHTAIPSVVFPSDHIALVADFKFKSKC